jgi:hypothetical protein
VISKKNDDPLELDELEVRIAAKNGVSRDVLTAKVKREFASAAEVAPNRVTLMPLDELLVSLGMETELKEKRFVDKRPKT